MSRPVHVITIVLSLAFAAYVIAYPLSVVTYPPLTDLPFHASAMTIMRHYFHASWHFREQFTLHPIAAPYISFYVLGALLAVVLPIDVAAKVATAIMLSLLPFGLAVFFRGMKKSPFWGLLGLGLVWSNLTHWGFLNFMGAVGLFAMSIGFALLALDKPTRQRQVLLTLSLAAIFFTHVFRFPFALLAVAVTALVMYPATRRVRPVVVPLIVNSALFGVWHLVRNDAFRSEMFKPALDRTHADKMLEHLVGGFSGVGGERELSLFTQMLEMLGVLALLAIVIFFVTGRSKRSPRARRWAIGVTALPLLLAGGFLIAYFTLPFRIGNWWYVYPRELTPAVFIALGVVPDMPRAAWARLGFVMAIGLVTMRVGYFVAEQFDHFEDVTSDFRAILPKIDRGTKLLYLVFDYSGLESPYSRLVHLPAWVQADRGGWLSFQFASWDLGPIRYREGGVVPPKVPERWEWEPAQFRVLKHGAWFDEFLVRDATNPSWRFREDSSIRLHAHQGSWWLYRRKR